MRRSQDVINPNTTHLDIMVLSGSVDQGNQPFLFARVLGIFHVNLVYATNTEKVNYRPRKVEFLWVRWFRSLELPLGWGSHQLDCLSFPLVEDENSFGFLDPADILRSCHILPRVALGRVDENLRGVSKCAKDLEDWRMYYVNK